MPDLFPEWPNLAAMMFDRARTWPARPMLRHFQGGAWRVLRWEAFDALVAARGMTVRARSHGTAMSVTVHPRRGRVRGAILTHGRWGDGGGSSRAAARPPDARGENEAGQTFFDL